MDKGIHAEKRIAKIESVEDAFRQAYLAGNKIPPSYLGLLVLSLAFVVMLVIDLRAVASALLPPWYGRLRWLLTIPIIPCVFSGSLLIAV